MDMATAQVHKPALTSIIALGKSVFRIWRTRPTTLPHTLVVLMYHKLSLHTQDSLTVRQDQFAAQLQWLQAHHYTPISFAELAAHHQAQVPLPEKPIIISFDDNYQNNFELAYPLLKQFGFKATIFVPVGLVGKTNIWDGGNEPLMSYETMRQMTDLVEFGVHSHQHRDYRSLSMNEVRQDISQAAAVAAESGFPYSPVFAYPFGGLPKNILQRRQIKEWLRASGFVCAARIKGIANTLPLRDLYEITRIGISGDDSLQTFIAKVEHGKA
ncbi:MAG: polysaccharide deacetylase family protein [Chloroherpetonaceae bacterium]|nr:polysaccharide deacetylase family protein [Chloroherpetonaceae bacterium]